MVFARFAARAVVDADGSVAVHGSGVGRALLEAGVAELAAPGSTAPPADPTTPAGPGGWRSSLDRPAFEARVASILELLRAGECYQVNLTRRLTHDGAVDPVLLFERIARTHPAPYAGFLRVRLPGTGAVAVVTASPERYLRVDGRAVETRPIKGTAADAAALRASAKDHAENVMIVDLARNDLGRVCEPGSIHVPELCAVESHPGLHHLVSTVRGTRRDDVGLGALVAATFPPASVTGAPKPRVLQAIEELEPVRRGVYCGGFGWVDTELRPRRPRGRHPHVRGVSRPRRARSRRGHRRRLVTRRRMGRDRAQGGAAAAGGRRRSTRSLMSGASSSIVWIEGGLVPEAEARVVTVRPRHPRRRRRVRDDAGVRRRAVRLAPPLRPAGPVRRGARPGTARPGGTARGRRRGAAPPMTCATPVCASPSPAGASPLGSERGDGPPTVVVAASPLKPWAPIADVVVVPWVRNERGAVAGLKTTSYAENVRALAYAHERGSSEAVLANTRDELCEATGSNVFVVRDGVVRTPPESAGCLLGVTRALVLELCAELAIPADECPLPIGALARADEAFLTSTVREVQPIGAVDGRRVARGARPALVRPRRRLHRPRRPRPGSLTSPPAVTGGGGGRRRRRRSRGRCRRRRARRARRRR